MKNDVTNILAYMMRQYEIEQEKVRRDNAHKFLSLSFNEQVKVVSDKIEQDRRNAIRDMYLHWDNT